jgi:protein involved in polysaccharide export with SLBB domain
MQPGKARSLGKASRHRHARRRWDSASLGVYLLAAFFFCFLPFGCAHKAQERHDVFKNLMSDRVALDRKNGVEGHYQVGCPDRLEIVVAGRWKIQSTVGADGRINLGEHGQPRVEGRSERQIAEMIASDFGVAPAAIHVKVLDYCSQQLFLFGQVVGWQRSVPYKGQETVLDLLQRVGGINPGAEPSEVYVVRTHLADGGRPEICHVDLHAIVVDHNQKTNLRLLPNDQIYVGETRQALVERAIPPWFRPVYQALWNVSSR